MTSQPLRTPLGNITAKILNSVTSLGSKLKVKKSGSYSAMRLQTAGDGGQVYCGQDENSNDIMESAKFLPHHHQDTSDVEDAKTPVSDALHDSTPGIYGSTHGLYDKPTGLQGDNYVTLSPAEEFERQRLEQTYRGQLKVALYMNSGLLTVHVIQGRHFSSQYKSTCDSYVQVSLIPDDNHSPSCHTDTVLDTNHPHYDEKVSFELFEEDEHKRVLISVCQQDQITGRVQLLGSMSFGIKKITTKCAAVTGWYYLLSDDVGRRKHFLVTSRRWEHEAREEQRHHSAENCNSPVTFKMHAVTVRRGAAGYGFTVTGGCPAKVCRIQQGGPADVAGLKSGDVIVKINQEPLHMASVEGVARIIRHCPRKVLLEVQRPHKSSASHVPSWQPAYSDLDSSTCSSSDDDGEGSVWWGDEGAGDEDKDNTYQSISVPARTVKFQGFF